MGGRGEKIRREARLNRPREPACPAMNIST
jgi:hypothetical protein